LTPGSYLCEVTFKKYLVLLPSGRMTETFPVVLQAERPQDSAETILAPFGRAVTKLLSAPKVPESYALGRIYTFEDGLVNSEVSINSLYPYRVRHTYLGLVSLRGASSGSGFQSSRGCKLAVGVGWRGMRYCICTEPC
jgi:hypothetical protein